MCEHEHNHEHCDESMPVMKIFAAILIFIIAILLDTPETIKFSIFMIAYLIAGGDVLSKAFKHIVKGKIFDENFLMGIATLGAIAIHEYPEAVMVMILYQIGEYFQHRAIKKSKNSITKLMDIRPDYANIEDNGKIIKKSPDEINMDDIIIVKTGERIPLDGIIIEGEATVDTSALTGESAPKIIKQGSNAISGCIDTNGLIKIRVTKEFRESTVSKILELVEHASSKKAKTENFITRFAKYYTPLVVSGALLLAFIPPLIIGGEFVLWIERALTFLVISCPCALVISVPLGFFAGIGGASKNGILVKGSTYLEALSNPYAVVFDKTGTLTKGNFAVTEVNPEANISKDELLELATLAEYYSDHPIAVSLKAAYNKDSSKKISNVREIAGNGIEANIDNNVILAGNSKLLEKYHIQHPEIDKSGTIIYVAKNNEYLGHITISDEIKTESYNAIISLKKLANKIVMLTGDSLKTAEAVGKQLGITNIYAQLLPDDKVEKIEELINEKPKNKNVIFAGDGINDAPVLTRSDVGIAMGGLGSDAAIEAADIVIMDDNPSKISTAIKISKRTMSIVKQNIIFAIGVKVVFLILGAFGFMTMWGAVFADVGVTLIAVINSLRALHIKTRGN